MLFNLLHRFAGNAAMKSHKIYAIFGMKTTTSIKIFCGKCCKVSLIMNNAVVYRNRTDHGRTLACKFSAKGCVLPWEERSIIASAPI